MNQVGFVLVQQRESRSLGDVVGVGSLMWCFTGSLSRLACFGCPLQLMLCSTLWIIIRCHQSIVNFRWVMLKALCMFTCVACVGGEGEVHYVVHSLTGWTQHPKHSPEPPSTQSSTAPSTQGASAAR